MKIKNMQFSWRNDISLSYRIKSPPLASKNLAKKGKKFGTVKNGEIFQRMGKFVVDRSRERRQNDGHMREEKSLELLSELSNACGISGHEDAVREIFLQRLHGQGEFSNDANGSIFCSGGDGPVVMIAGHMDEVGFMVQNITSDGFLQFVGIGGWWPHTLLSQRVVVSSRSGKMIPGVIGSKPPHFLPDAQRNSVMSIDGMFIDIGAESKSQVMDEFGIRIGDPITPDVKFSHTSNPHRFMGKAFDNRIGMAAAIEAFDILSRDGHPNRLVAAGTVQEEVGVRGARTAAFKMKPDCVIVLEAPPADDTPGFAISDAQGKMGSGVQIRFFDPTSIMNPRLAKFAVEVAEKSEIPHQVTVRRSGGTDAKEFHLAGEGIPCIVLGVPTRYIHAHNGLMDIRDYRAMVDLAVSMVKKLDKKTVDSFTQYL